MLKQRLINLILTPIILGYIIFEELVWERLAQPIIRLITRLKLLHKLENYLKTANSKLILIIFVLLFVSVELLGMFAASLFLQTKVVHGIVVYAAKVPVSAFTFWLFNATRHKLMEFEWFKRAYQLVMRFIDIITHSDIYARIKALSARLKDYLKQKLSSDKSLIMDFVKNKVQATYRRLKTLVNRKL